MKKFFIGLILLNSISATVLANGNEKEKDAKKTAQVQVIGEKDDFVYVKVSFTTNPDLAPSMQVTDGVGETLYTERISDSSFSRMLKFSTNELPGGLEISLMEKGAIVKKYNVNVSYVKTYALEEVAKN